MAATPPDGTEASPSGNPGAADYHYNDGDGKGRKATIEHIFPALEGLKEADGERPLSPWQVGWQMNERNLVWDDDLKVRLIKRIASDELGISEEEMDWRLKQLTALLPGLEARLIRAPPKLIARLAAHTSEVAGRLLQLKAVFPTANAAAMVNNRLTLLLPDDVPGLERAAERLGELLPGLNLDAFVERYPLVLDIDNFEMALEDARRIMPGSDIVQLLRSNPELVLSLVKGKNLLPYDEYQNPWS